MTKNNYIYQYNSKRQLRLKHNQLTWSMFHETEKLMKQKYNFLKIYDTWEEGETNMMKASNYFGSNEFSCCFMLTIKLM